MLFTFLDLIVFAVRDLFILDILLPPFDFPDEGPFFSIGFFDFCYFSEDLIDLDP